MAFLGHSKGPKISEILKRNRKELESLTERVIYQTGDKKPTDLIGDMITEEEKKEAEGVVAWAKFTREHKPNEFIYQFDCGIKSGVYGVRLHYTLTDEEMKMLGSGYKWDLLPTPYATEEMRERAIWDWQTGYGEFSGQGLS
jgi:hypothetical protein